jgi:homoserine acetyltransferase
MAQNQDYEVFKLGDWELQSGEKIIDAHIAYKTFGDPKSPAIVYPSWYSGCMFVLITKIITITNAYGVTCQQFRTISG